MADRPNFILITDQQRDDAIAALGGLDVITGVRMPEWRLVDVKKPRDRIAARR